MDVQYILGRLSSTIVGLALDPPVPIPIYPVNWPPDGQPAPPPTGYPTAIYWGFPSPAALAGTDPAYPAGTLFIWSEAADLSHGGGGLVGKVISFIPGAGLLPIPLHTAGVPMQWIQTNIHAKLGTTEQMVHSLKWSPDGGGAVPATTDAQVLTFAQLVADKWYNLYILGGVTLGTGVLYDEVRAGVYEQTTPNVSGQSAAGHMHQVNGVTQLAPITVATSANAPLPWEVAMCVTLRTAFPQTGGSSHGRRNRGRTYLGGLGQATVSTDAKFTDAAVGAFNTAFSAFVNAVNGLSAYHLSVVSLADLQDRTVTRTQIGHVPDVIRKRRNAQLEVYGTGIAIT